MAGKKKLIKVTQVKSPIGRKDYQEKNLIGLGLNKLNRSKLLEDTPSIRGMINKVSHLVEVEEDIKAAQLIANEKNLRNIKWLL